jgi:hypothetical protein
LRRPYPRSGRGAQSLRDGSARPPRFLSATRRVQVFNGRASKGKEEEGGEEDELLRGHRPLTIIERNRQVRAEVRVLYLEERLLKNRKANRKAHVPLPTPSAKKGSHSVIRARLSH